MQCKIIPTYSRGVFPVQLQLDVSHAGFEHNGFRLSHLRVLAVVCFDKQRPALNEARKMDDGGGQESMVG